MSVGERGGTLSGGVMVGGGGGRFFQGLVVGLLEAFQPLFLVPPHRRHSHGKKTQHACELSENFGDAGEREEAKKGGGGG